MPENDPLPGRPYFGRIDSVRGLGSLAIAAYHFTRFPLNGRTFLPHPQQPWVDVDPVTRTVGVGLYHALVAHPMLLAFFVISGFVLRVALEYGPRPAGASSLKFVINRVFRIFPIVAVGVLTVWPSSAGAFLEQLLLLDIEPNRHFWSLQVEVLMVPIILALFFLERRFGPRVPVVAAAVTAGLAFVTRWAVWPILSVHVFAFVLGMAMPTAGRAFALRLSRRGMLCWYAAGGAVALFAGPRLGMYSVFTILLEGFAAVVVLNIVAFRPDAPLLGFLDNRWLRRLGGAAGSVYVLHMAAIPPMLALAGAVVPPEWTAAAPLAVGVGVTAVWLALLAPLMVVVSRLVEVPGIAAGRKLVGWLGLNRKAEPRRSEPAPAVRLAA